MFEPVFTTPIASASPWLEVCHITHDYRIGHDWLGRAVYREALCDVNLSLNRGRTLGLVGESGCGKSTLARIMLGLQPPTHGVVRYAGKELPEPNQARWRGLRCRMQMVFQDPYACLDKRMNVLDQVAEPLLMHRLAPREAAREQAREILRLVGIPAHHLMNKPGSLSGGQLQRVVIARAIILNPDVLICDEPTASLDVSVQAQVLALLDDLRARTGMTMLFVSHNLNVVRYISDEVAVMYLGRVVEMGPVNELFFHPAHPYTELLLSSTPGSKRVFVGLARDQSLSDPLNQPDQVKQVDLPDRPGCAFHSRCACGTEQCRASRPSLEPVCGQGAAHMVACFHPRAAWSNFTLKLRTELARRDSVAPPEQPQFFATVDE